MPDELIVQLQELVKTQHLVWLDYDGHYRKVSSVNLNFVEKGSGSDVAEPVAFLEGGGHISLWSTDPDDLFLMELKTAFSQEPVFSPAVPSQYKSTM